MASLEHLEVLEQGAQAWNRWRAAHPHLVPDLSGATLREARLSEVNLAGTDLSGCDLGGAFLAGGQLSRAALPRAMLNGANLTGADLSRAELVSAALVDADLSGAILAGANLTEADLPGANLDGATLRGTIFNGCRLTGARNLDRCIHLGVSYVDARTFERSRGLHPGFLRGCGLPAAEVERYRLGERAAERGAPATDGGVGAARAAARRLHSCFISYNERDAPFAQRLYADLVNSGASCFYAPEHMRIGNETLPTVLRAIDAKDRLLVVLSEHAAESAWVEDEVMRALARERRERTPVLLPIRIDDAVTRTATPWAQMILERRHVGDFSGWRHEATYRAALERLLRDLAVHPGDVPAGPFTATATPPAPGS
jgi:hypothetical protein